MNGRAVGCTSALLALLALALQAQEAEGKIHDDARGRIEWFTKQRTYPYGKLPGNARRLAFERMRAQWPTAASRFAPSALGGSAWTALGPGNIPGLFIQSSGRVVALAVDPTNAAIVYAGGAQGGIWKSTTGGASWVPLTDDQCSLATGSIAIDPVTPAIIYAGTGELDFSADSYYGCGVLRSIDGGASWTQFGASVFDSSAGGARVSRVVVDRATAGSATGTTVLAATSYGIFRSTNSGQTWTRTFASATDLVQDPNDAAVYYAGVSNPFGDTTQGVVSGVYKSVNGGVNWALQHGGFPAANLGRIALAVGVTSPTTIYAAIQHAITNSNGGTLLGIWSSANAGTSWSAAAAAGGISCATQCWYDIVLAVDPTNAQIVYFGGFDLYRSTNGGASFTDISGNIHVDQHAIALAPTNPALAYVGNDGGVYSTTNARAAGIPVWTSRNTNIALTQFYPGVSVGPTGTSQLLGGSQDNGTVEYAGSQSWLEALGGDGGYTAINYNVPTTVFAEPEWFSNSGFSGPYRRDASSDFTQKVAGINEGDRGAFIPPLVMDPVNPAVLYFGTYRMYRTSTSGDLWQSVSGDLSATGKGVLSAIAVAKSNPKTVYAGTTDGAVRVSIDAGSNWSAPLPGLPQRSVTDLAVDPADATHAWVTFSGFRSGHIFETKTRGATWQDVSGNLIDIPVNAIVLQPASGELDIGTDLGVFASGDAGHSWTPFSTGLPAVAVFDLVFHQGSNTLVAATHGRGMWSMQIPSNAVLRGDVDGNGVVNAADAQAILAATLGLPLPTGSHAIPNGDANCDGVVSAVDAEIVLAYVVGMPTGGACVGMVR